MAAKGRVVGEIVNDDQNRIQFLVLLLLHVVDDLMLGVNDLMQVFRVVVIEIDWILFRVLNVHLLINVRLHW